MTTALQQPSLSSQCMAEFLGTALLIFFGTGCVAALKVAGASFGLWEISIIWGVGVSMAIYLTAGVSGAHLNPAVSIALSIFADFEKRKLPFYILLPGGRRLLRGFVGLHAIQQPFLRFRTNSPNGSWHPGQP